jgi:hypothetical protein
VKIFFFKNDIVPLVKIQIYSNLFFRGNKKSGNVRRLEQILSRLVKIFFQKKALFHWLTFKYIQICDMGLTCKR